MLFIFIGSCSRDGSGNSEMFKTIKDLVTIFMISGFILIVVVWILSSLLPFLFGILMIWLLLWSYGKENQKALKRKPRRKVADEDDELENDRA